MFKEDSSKIQQGRKSGKWLKVTIFAVKGPMVVISTGASIFSGKYKQAGKIFGHWIWKNFRIRVSEQEHLCCGFLADVKLMFGSCSLTILFLSAIFDRQGLLVAAPVNLRTKNAESLSPQLLQGFWSKLKKKNPKIVVMLPTVTTKNSKQKETICQQHRLCLAVAEHQILGGKHFLVLGPESGKIWWLKKGTIPAEKVPLPMDPPARQETQVDFP